MHARADVQQAVYPSEHAVVAAAGLRLGRAVAEPVPEYAARHGSDVVWSGQMSVAPGSWTGEKPVEPNTCSWKTWTLTSGSVEAAVKGLHREFRDIG